MSVGVVDGGDDEEDGGEDVAGGFAWRTRDGKGLGECVEAADRSRGAAKALVREIVDVQGELLARARSKWVSGGRVRMVSVLACEAMEARATMEAISDDLSGGDGCDDTARADGGNEGLVGRMTKTVVKDLDSIELARLGCG